MADAQVFLVGAGPGHPGLITLRAVECLASADYVLYDRLVPLAILEHAPNGAEMVCVAELAPSHPDRCPLIHAAMIEAARQGKRVVRLKGGDPCLFGRGAEEAEALRAAGISYEFVPGVTSGLAVPECAGIPLTHRLLSSGVALVTGQEHPAKPENAVDWKKLASFPGTIVVYMGIARLQSIVDDLLAGGKSPHTPAAVVRWGSTNQQQTVTSTLRELPQVVQRAGIRAPAITVIGEVVSLRQDLEWFEKRPLFGKKVLVTRPRAQAGDMIRRLERLGAQVVAMPTVEIADPADWSPVDRALQNLHDFQWLVFTSANGVRAFMQRLRHLQLDLRCLGHVKLATIGPITAEALRTYHLESDLIPAEYRSETLAADLKSKVAGQRVLLARADRGRDLLQEELSGIAKVEQIAIYSQRDSLLDAAALDNLFGKNAVDMVTLTSSNIARALFRNLSPVQLGAIRDRRVQLVSISPVTSQAIREFDLPVSAEAKEYTTAGVIEAILNMG